MRASKSRREFLETMGQVGAGALLAAATGLETTRGYAANDTIEVACIGTGGRCRTLMKSLANIPNVRIAAVCDIYEPHLEEGRKLADSKAHVSRAYRELLDRKDIDAVLIGSPDHWHVPMTIDACKAGKDVYVEKPLTHDLAEGAAVIKAQNETRKIVQIGTQQRSMPHIMKAKELVDQGRIGRIFKVHLTWNRNTRSRMLKGPLGVDPKQVDWKAFLGSAPEQPFDEYRFRNWRWFWNFGGGLLTDLMVHWIDVAHWFLDLDHPEQAAAIGDQLASKGVWETPDTIQCLLHYPNEIQAYFEGTFSNARNGAMIEFMGTDGTLYIDRGRYEIHPEGGKGKPEEWILGTDPHRGRDFYDKPDGELLHLTNWIDCVRSRQRPHCPAEAGVSAASAAHLGNRAYRSGQLATWTSA
ncbi:Predicted dehydrogenase [Singulisphaera sp. GP187]|uniref:Gfo/Idh/MocA family protein n=1 Tax=Singulisphaera sp. GP187 TaxID=1882752 RepID=UPI000927CABB|nr:Gfo/Idh/MocA family oxidoreductase [Singulisphaera sp. GP187]SIO60284.1 Predicted dehydrogenase [Singulisphaera sp. GP187]